MSENLGGFEHRVLLAMMRLGACAYTVPIVDELERVGGRTVSPSAVYVTLRRLEKRALLTSEMAPPGPGEGGRDRRVFTVTADGVRLLRDTRRDLMDLWSGVEALKP
ncbi:MAG: PadR family transcriptional regulator [Gemmatimonadetes bacterium]|nr:PadR family transcriptional regulator [Gemmatimonadota bacterium]